MSNHHDAKNKNTCSVAAPAASNCGHAHQMADKQGQSQDRERRNQNEKHHGKGRDERKK